MNKKWVVILICLILMFCLLLIHHNRNINNENNNNSFNMEEKDSMILYITIDDVTLRATLVNNSSSIALLKKLEDKDITIDIHDYGNFEKVGALGFDLPTNDSEVTTEAGDIILYQGNQLTIYYDTNSWNFTKLGHIDNISKNELKKLLGNDNVTVTLSINKK